MTFYEDEEHVMKRKGTTQHMPNYSILRILPCGASANARAAAAASAAVGTGTNAHATIAASATAGTNSYATTATRATANTSPYAVTAPHTAPNATAATRGSSLIWVMVVVLIMIIVLGVGLTAVSGHFNLSSTRHDQQQAYYTALSSTDTLSAWIMKGDANAEQLLSTIPGPTDNPDSIIVNANGLPAEVGTCEVNMRFLDPEKTTLKIASTATFAGASETVSLTLARGGNTSAGSPFEDELKVSDYSTATADTRAAQLSNLKSGGIVALYKPNADNESDRDANAGNLDLVNYYIQYVNSNAEARWTNVKLTANVDGFHDDILGTQHYSPNAYDGTALDYRRFMVPDNGRITIDPLEQDSNVYVDTSPKAGKNDANNTRLVSMAIDNTAGKDVLFRLASGSSAKSSGLLNMSSLSTFYDRTQARWASLLMFNFTDNGKKTETVNYTVNGEKRAYTWHPNEWNKLDIFVQPNSDVVSNLVIGPFGHKYDTTGTSAGNRTSAMDYLSYGNFVDNWHGTNVGDFKYQWDYVKSTMRDNQKGLPIFPADYGKNANFWILDKRPDRYFRVMQGVNIMEGTIYSTRQTIIGGALIRSNDNYTTDSLNRAVDGFASLDPTIYATYVEATTRYTLFIYKTDIILKAPSSGTANSLIRRPDTWEDRQDIAKVTAKEKQYAPAVIIKGGTICIDKGQSLTIQGSSKNNMWVEPDKIVVAPGGALTIESSAFTNVLTDIYVDGGALTIKKGARIAGNIYAYNNATVNVLGDFTLDSLHSTADEQAHDGLLIYGEKTVEIKIGTVTISSAAQIKVPSILPSISGTSGKVHLVGGDWTSLVSGTSASVANAGSFLCPGYDTRTGRCLHIGGSGDWALGVYGSG
jgi:hypothetical protein